VCVHVCVCMGVCVHEWEWVYECKCVLKPNLLLQGHRFFSD